MVHEFPSLSEKTRSIIVSTFTSMVDVFQRSPLRELFCTETNLVPEAVQAGKVIVMALPVKEFGELGQLSQVLMKYIFMRSIERRLAEADPRPVFLWVDESQLFATDYDFMFQTTARSARVCTVYLTQSLSNYYATLGAGEEGKAACDSLLGNLNRKLFHANGDAVTNEWAATMIGRSRQYFVNANNSYQADAWPQNWFGNAAGQTSAGVNEVMEFEVQPRRFTTLRKGGFAFQGLVDAIVFQGGRRYRHNGRTWLPVTFQQQF
ncbi:MAG: type IV secretory system conjugative DNA transfer family protein [Planctomycetaceae bacterium]|nr:type IV secretory system conjugative DNA transfer family protein [Planctomycetaceae bacterium]